MSSQHKGIVTQIIGPVLDIRFAEGELPALRNAITIQHREQVITAEVAQHIGDNRHEQHRWPGARHGSY